jgi:PGF-CTERM protein
MDKPSIGSTRELLIGVAIIGVVIMAVTAAAEPATISSSGPNEAEPGTQVTISYTLTNTGANKSAYILDLSLPANWTVVNHTDDGATWKSTDNSWLWQTVDPGESVTPSVTLEIPSDAAPGDYIVNGTVKSNEAIEAVNNHTITVEQQETASPTSTQTPTQTPTQQPADENVSVNLTVSQSELAPGETVTVEPTLTNTGSGASAYILDLSLPANWTVINRTNDGGTWKSADNSWLWQTVQPGDSVAPSVTVEVPDDAANRTYTIEATGKSTDGNATVARSVTVKSDATTPPGDTETGAAIAPFSQTAELTSSQLEDGSLSGKIRVEEPTANNTTTSVALLRASSSNYSIAITAPDNAENVTFYLQAQAITASQDVEDLTMYLDDDKHPFVVNESAGPGNSPWVAFNIPQFSTRTVSFTTDGEGAGETGAELELASTEITAGSTTTADIVVTNASDGVGEVNVTTSLSSGENATITDVSLDSSADSVEIQTNEDNTSVRITGSGLNTTDTGRVSVGTVTIRGDTTGSTDVLLQVNRLANESSVAYSVTSITNATLSITSSDDDGGGGDGGGGGSNTTTTSTTTTTTSTTATTTTTTTTTDDPITDVTDTTGSDAPGFGPLITLIGFLSAVLLTLRQRR